MLFIITFLLLRTQMPLSDEPFSPYIPINWKGLDNRPLEVRDTDNYIILPTKYSKELVILEEIPAGYLIISHYDTTAKRLKDEDSLFLFLFF